MQDIHPHISKLIRCIDLEEQEQVNRFRLDQQHGLKALKAEGLALHPLIITRRTFGYADYPEVSFKLMFPQEHQFRDGAAIECFCDGEEPVKGVLLNIDGRSGEFRLFAPDFPDWLDDKHTGIKLSPDQRTTSLMKKALRELPSKPDLYALFCRMHDGQASAPQISIPSTSTQQDGLNESQQQAVRAILENDPLCVVHGPPGTGKTTTLIEAVSKLVQNGKKVLVAAPANAAVDHFASGLLRKGLRILRVGNTTKVNDQIFPFTLEGKLRDSKQQKEIKDLKIKAAQFRKMALTYKRSFGKAEREQRSLLFKEVRQIRDEIRVLQAYNEEKLFQDADVVLGTPIALLDANLKMTYDTLILDEAGQCLEPLAWSVFHLAHAIVLAGDPFQLPPTVMSPQAMREGLARSILEVCFNRIDQVHLLNIQYRMRDAIAGFSNQYFYQGLLKSAAHLTNQEIEHVTFYDTAGTGYQEEQGSGGGSLQNPGELELVQAILQQEAVKKLSVAFISPYSAQVTLALEKLNSPIRISTIDSFQGQEQEVVLISLVRSNDEGEIGFLKDYRRMNVALTRAKDMLIVIGDSATLGQDPFYHRFLTYVEQFGAYKSAYELMDVS
jgi:hypothetical protein